MPNIIWQTCCLTAPCCGDVTDSYQLQFIYSLPFNKIPTTLHNNFLCNFKVTVQLPGLHNSEHLRIANTAKKVIVVGNSPLKLCNFQWFQCNEHFTLTITSCPKVFFILRFYCIKTIILTIQLLRAIKHYSISF